VLKVPEASSADYRDAMAEIAEHVHVVSTDGAAGRRVVVATAVTSVSDSPPTVLVCLNRHNPLNDAYVDNGVFCISTLAEPHRPLAEICSGMVKATQEERFARGRWITGTTGAPVLADALASFDCEIVETMDMATHRILFGRVRSVRRDGDQRPLIYHKRGFHLV